MFSLNRALFLNHLRYLSPFYVFLFFFWYYFGLSVRMIVTVLVLLGIAWMVMAVGSRTNLRLQRKVQELHMTDLYRDYLLADKTAGFAIGEKFFYWWQGPTICLLPYSDINRMYAVQKEYYTDSQVISDKYYLCIRDCDGNEHMLRCDPKRQKTLFLHILAKNAPVHLGYK